MSFEPDDTIQYPFTESTDAPRPGLFFAPIPQPDAPSPELFDQEIAELNLDSSFEPINEFFTTFRDSIPPVISTPLDSTYSTGAVYGATSSHSSPSFTQLGHSILSELESYYLLDNELYGTCDSIHPTVFSNSPPSIPPLRPTETQFNFGTSDLSLNLVGISPATVLQPPPTSVVPTPHSAHVTPVLEAQMAPAPDRPVKNPHSPHSSKRKHNLRTRIRTHNKSNPFECTTCGCRFSRKNDLHRHCRNPSIHRRHMSMSSISRRRYDPNPDLPHRITINGDSRLTTSAYSDLSCKLATETQ